MKKSQKAMEEGVRFAECLSPEEVVIDSLRTCDGDQVLARAEIDEENRARSSDTGESEHTAGAERFW